MSETSERAKRAAQSILENESLTNGLNDSAASKLIEWGIARANAAAGQTAGMDEPEADAYLEESLRSLRRMLKGASRWAQALLEADAETARDNLLGAIEQAAAVYGSAFQPPADPQREALLSPSGAPAGEPAALIARLRSLLEPLEAPAQRAAALPAAEPPPAPSEARPPQPHHEPPPEPALLADAYGEMPTAYYDQPQDPEAIFL